MPADFIRRCGIKDLIFITGSQHKADSLARHLSQTVKHQKLDLDELQSLDLLEVVEHKVHEAYKIVGRPVLVEDVALTFVDMGRLPGTFIKWFFEELGSKGLCRLADSTATRRAVASIAYGLYDGQKIHVFTALTRGTIANNPSGKQGFGWDPIFIPEGSTKTYAEMTESETEPYSMRVSAVEKLQSYLQNQ